MAKKNSGLGRGLDAIFLDKNDNVVKTVKNIRPWRFFIWGGFKAVKVLEIKSKD